MDSLRRVRLLENIFGCHLSKYYSILNEIWYTYLGESVALLVARRTNNRKVVGSRPTKVVRITVLTRNT